MKPEANEKFRSLWVDVGWTLHTASNRRSSFGVRFLYWSKNWKSCEALYSFCWLPGIVTSLTAFWRRWKADDGLGLQSALEDKEAVSWIPSEFSSSNNRVMSIAPRPWASTLVVRDKLLSFRNVSASFKYRISEVSLTFLLLENRKYRAL